jgi:hypothetical protein
MQLEQLYDERAKVNFSILFPQKWKQNFYSKERRPWNSKVIIETTLPVLPFFLERLMKEGGKRGEIILKVY